MLIGIYWGYVAMIEGLIERMKRELGRPVTVVATGGLATCSTSTRNVFDAIEPDLTIQGLSLLYDMAERGSARMIPGRRIVVLSRSAARARSA